MLERITFLLAALGYAGLTVTAVRAALGSIPRALWRGVVLVVVAHVLLVWSVRYDWRFAEATRNGYVGFALFHGALLAMLMSLAAPERLARRLVWAAFLVVSVGAIGATVRYDVVAVYRIPVLVCAAAGLGGLLVAIRRHRVQLARAGS